MARSIALTALALAACSDYELNEGGEVEPSEIAIEVAPTSIDFGDLRTGEVQTRRFTIASVGEGELSVDAISLGAGSDGFSVLTPAPTELLPPGAEVEVEVSFSPLGAEDQAGLVIILSNADNLPEAWVEMAGRGLVPELEIAPDPYDFGDVFLGCDAEVDLTLTNVGNDALVIDDLQASGEDMVYAHDLAFPLTLAPGEQREVNVHYEPTRTGEDFLGSMTAWSNEPIGERAATQSAAAALVDEHIDEFYIEGDPPTDIMFVVDQSCSMGDDQERLRTNFDYFISNLEGFTDDWQIIVGNNEGGCYNTGSILRPSTPDYQSAFSQAVSSGTDDHIDDPERLLTTAYNGVYNTDAGECNSGFMREDAVLHVILVSDEEEQSASPLSLAQGIMDKKFLQTADYSMVRISAIAGDVPGGCATADPGYGYDEAVTASGGVFLSICETDWTPYMEELAQTSVNPTTFELSDSPWEPTLEVFINDAPVPAADWVYDAAANAIEFINPDNRPGGGDTVVVSYGEWYDCN